MGPFAGYQRNAARDDRRDREAPRRRRQHRGHRHGPGRPARRPRAQSWDDALNLGEVHGYRNAQATVLAPTGCLVGDSLVSTSRGLVRLRSARRSGRREVAGRSTSRSRPTRARARRRSSTSTASSRSSRSRPAAAIASRARRRTGSRSSTSEGEWVWRRFGEIREGDRVPLMLNGMVGEPQEVELPPLGELYWTADFRTRVPRDDERRARRARRLLHGRRLAAREGPPLLRRERRHGRRRAPRSSSARRSSASTRTSPRRRATPRSRSTRCRSPSGGRRAASRSCRLGRALAARAGTRTSRTRSCTRTTATSTPRSCAASSRRTGRRTTATSRGARSRESFSRDVQTLLLALGFVTTRKVDDASSNWGTHERYVLRLLNVVGRRALPRGDRLHLEPQGRVARDRRPSGRPRATTTSRSRRALVDELAPENDALRKTMLMALAAPRRRLAPLGDRAARAHGGRRARAPARLLLRRGRDGRDCSTTSRPTTSRCRTTSRTWPTASSATTRSAS